MYAAHSRLRWLGTDGLRLGPKVLYDAVRRPGRVLHHDPMMAARELDRAQFLHPRDIGIANITLEVDVDSAGVVLRRLHHEVEAGGDVVVLRVVRELLGVLRLLPESSGPEIDRAFVIGLGYVDESTRETECARHAESLERAAHVSAET